MSLISIIVPVYNVGDYVEKCVDSLLKQTYQEIEIILVNDGSTDSSGEICRRLSRGNDSVCLIEQENKGVSAARNTGLANAHGEYVMFVDPDDYCEPTYVEKLYCAISENGVDLAQCGYFIDLSVKERKSIRLPFETDRITDVYGALFYDKETGEMEKLPAFLWLGIFRNQIIQQHNISFDENVQYNEDYLFFVNYSLYCNTIRLVNEPLYHSVHRDGSSASRRKFTIDGSLKNLYVTDSFANIMENSTWEHKDCYVAKRYVHFVPQAVLLLLERRDWNIKEKKVQLQNLYKFSKIKEKLIRFNSCSFTKVEKMYYRLVVGEKIKTLLCWGKIFRILKRMKNKWRE